MTTERHVYTQNQKKIAEIPWSHNEEGCLEVLNTHGPY